MHIHICACVYNRPNVCNSEPWWDSVKGKAFGSLRPAVVWTFEALDWGLDKQVEQRLSWLALPSPLKRIRRDDGHSQIKKSTLVKHRTCRCLAFEPHSLQKKKLFFVV